MPDAKKSRAKPVDRLRDIVVPVVGPTGSGKSSFINSILERNEMIVGHDIDSCTAEIRTAVVDSSKISNHKWLKSYRLILVDTPGLDNADKNDYIILEDIVRYLGESYRGGLILAGVIYLQDISLDRVSGTTRRGLNMFNSACGVEGLKHVVLGATKWERIQPDDAANRFIRLKEVHWKDMMDAGAQVFGINEDEPPQRLLNAILERFDEDLVLKVQRETVDENKPLRDTAVGKEVLSYKSRWKDFMKKLFRFGF